jgi:hypothetical protein
VCQRSYIHPAGRRLAANCWAVIPAKAHVKKSKSLCIVMAMLDPAIQEKPKHFNLNPAFDGP